MLADSIESIQKKFVLFALRRSVRRDADFQLPPYDERRALEEDLSGRRRLARVFYLYDVLTGKVEAPVLSIMVYSCLIMFRLTPTTFVSSVHFDPLIIGLSTATMSR